MKVISAFKTFDDVIHETRESAKSHIKKKYDTAMTLLRREMMKNPKVGAQEAYHAAVFFEDNFSLLKQIMRIKDDLIEEDD